MRSSRPRCRVPSGVNARHPNPSGRSKAGSPGLGASSWPGCVVRLSTTSAGFATRRRRMTSSPRWPSGRRPARTRRRRPPLHGVSRGTGAGRPPGPTRPTSPPDSPQSNLVPSGEKARRRPAPLITRRAQGELRESEPLDRPAGADVEDRDPRTRGIDIRGGDEPAVRRERDRPDVTIRQRASVPIRSRARGGRGGWALSTSGGALGAGVGVAGMAGACGRAAGVPFCLAALGPAIPMFRQPWLSSGVARARRADRRSRPPTRRAIHGPAAGASSSVRPGSGRSRKGGGSGS